MKYKFKPSHVVPAFLFVVAVLYGGSKPAGTNTPPDDVSSPTNALPQNANQHESNESPRMMLNRFASIRPIGEDSRFASISNWTARGAYCDWERIEFGNGFAFPVSTNFIDTVTVFAYGEIVIGSSSSRTMESSNLHCSPSTFALPSRVSLEPGVSSVTHGLTPSNSYLFAWHNCCVERCATNRIDATIELFRSGACLVRFGDEEMFYPAPVPPEYPGDGQDEDWIRVTFPDDADTILSMGYDSWLAQWVGVNEENGHYQCAVTVSALPADGAPCYLSCGPYKVNVTAPGTYRFPLEVFEQYEARTYPNAVPLSLDYDDGYRGEGSSFEIVEPESSSRTDGTANSSVRLRLLTAPKTLHRFVMLPKVVVTPSRVSLNEAVGKVVSLWVNVMNTIERIWSCASYNTRLAFTRNQAEINEARVAELAQILLEQDGRIARGELEITPLPIDESQVETNRFDVTIFEGETWHTAGTNGLYVKYFTVPTEVGTTNLVLDTNVYGPPAGRPVYVGVFMASAEDMGNIADCCDDRISWNVQVNGTSVLSGETSAYAHHDTLYAVALETHRLYGIEWPMILLGGCQVDPPSGDNYGIRLIGTAQNVGDGLRQTCLQIGIFPIDDNGNVVGWPSWAQR